MGDSLPSAAEPAHLSEALRRCGALRDGVVSGIAVESSRATLLSRIIRLRLLYDGDAGGAPGSVIVKTGLPERSGGGWNAGRQEVAFYRDIAAAMPSRLVLRCFEASFDADTTAWHLLLEDLTDSHAPAATWPLPPTTRQCEHILQVLARVHAAWWDDGRLGVTIGGVARRCRHRAAPAGGLPSDMPASPTALVIACQLSGVLSMSNSLRRHRTCSRATTHIAIRPCSRRRSCLELSAVAERRRRCPAVRLGQLAHRSGGERPCLHDGNTLVPGAPPEIRAAVARSLSRNASCTRPAQLRPPRT